MKNKRMPARYRYAVIPHVMVAGAERAIEFYRKAFDAKELFRVQPEGGPIIHAEMVIEGSLVMVGEANEPFKAPVSMSGTSTGLHVYVENVDARFAQALAAGAVPVQPVTDMFYGDRVGILKDPFGHIWVLLTSIKEMSLNEIQASSKRFFAEGK